MTGKYNHKFTRADVRFIFAMVVVHAVFFALALTFKRIYMGDSFEYVYMALNIKNDFWFYAGNPALPIQPEYLTIRPPGYPMFLAGVYLFTINNWVVIILQNLISIFNIYLFRDTIRKIGYSRRYDYLLIAFVLLFPPRFIYPNLIAPDLLLQTTVIFYFRGFIWLVTEKQMKHALWMTLALIAGVFIKPVLYPFTLFHALILVGFAISQRKAFLRMLLIGVFPILTIMSYNYWNLQRTGKFHFTSNQSFNAIYYFYFYFSDKDGTKKAQVFLQQERDKMAAMPAFADRYDYANARGIELLQENFWPYMAYHIRHSMRFFIDPGKGELDMFVGENTLGKLYSGEDGGGFYRTIQRSGWQGFMNYLEHNPTLPVALLVLFFNCIKILGVILFLFNTMVPRSVRIFTAFLLIYFAVTTGPIANTRYFLPVSFITTGCAAISYQQLLRRRKINAIITERSNRYYI